MTVIAVLALLLLIVSRAAQSGRRHDWGLVELSLGLIAILAIRILVQCLLILYSPSSRDDRRTVIGLVVKTLLEIMLLCVSAFLNRS